MTERELHRELLTPGVEDRAGRTVYEAAGRDPDLARAAWAFAHGMTILELDHRFPPDADLDAAWARGLDAFRHSAAVDLAVPELVRAGRRSRRRGPRAASGRCRARAPCAVRGRPVQVRVERQPEAHAVARVPEGERVVDGVHGQPKRSTTRMPTRS